MSSNCTRQNDLQYNVTFYKYLIKPYSTYKFYQPGRGSQPRANLGKCCI